MKQTPFGHGLTGIGSAIEVTGGGIGFRYLRLIGLVVSLLRDILCVSVALMQAPESPTLRRSSLVDLLISLAPRLNQLQYPNAVSFRRGTAVSDRSCSCSEKSVCSGWIQEEKFVDELLSTSLGSL
uniref:Uncharacterized protein n=1 Tax=Nelumbo nucifera TaxID=4432 RepID=A0A822ZMI5_NELNU|nr:TPA_asm: hypothetical protein HUJ06_002961 [Nelumbo nucifera]